MNPDVSPPQSGPNQQPAMPQARPTTGAPAPSPDAQHKFPTPKLEGAGGKPDHEGLKSILSTIAILIIAPIIALTLTTFVFQSYEVDGPSMESTLQNRDRLIVLKVPRTWARLTKHNYIPNRGDVIIFSHNESIGFGTNEPRQLIKRVIGLPGDRVVVKDGVVTIYNTENPDGFKPDATMPYGSVIGDTSGDIDTVVSADHVFVCGDNRGNSLDSRAFGAVPAKAIVGKLLIRVFPIKNAELF